VRTGLHTGEAEQRDGDYFGTAVNHAARVMTVAHGGQILCSRVTAELAGEAFPVRSLGEPRLRDLGAAEELFQVGGGVFPPLRSLDTVPTNLPVARTDLIGRSDEVAALSALVRGEELVTLTGVGAAPLGRRGEEPRSLHDAPDCRNMARSVTRPINVPHEHVHG
jgi:Adenylate and Guanylate cyclase catalytic domain